MAVPAKPPANGDIIESVLIKGDLAKLTPDERMQYYKEVCKSLGLNPLTQPFAYIILNGKLQLYALRACADQLRKIHGVSLEIVSRDVADDILTIHVRAKLPDGRVDEDLGSVAFSSALKGEARANAELKCVTKAKRRATLSICGLGWLDETEVADIPAKAKTAWQPSAPAPNPMQTIPCDPTTGEIIDPFPTDSGKGAAAVAAPTDAAAAFDLAEEAHEAANRGEKTFKFFWKRLTKVERDQLLPMQSEFRRLMDEADRAARSDQEAER
jgi:hypothetical protein